MTPRRVVGRTAEHVVFRGSTTSVPGRLRLPVVMRRPTPAPALARIHLPSPSRRTLHTTHPQTRDWSITPPRPPTAHPLTSPASTSSPPTTHDDTKPSPPPSTKLSHDLRTLMRLLPHSVVICTATHPAHTTSHNKSPIPRAMTMSSFTSVTLLPTPVISFNIAAPSRTLDAIAASRTFNIHILSDDVDGARVADHLSRGNGSDKKKVFERITEECGCELVMGKEETEAPVLRGPGVLYVLRCGLLDDDDGPAGGLVRVRDHVIVLGEVREIVEGAHKSRVRDERFGLLYADRRYRQLGNCITPVKGHG
ncbi:flavin reductase like domain-containing protein [Echria macrotheca]|uniref:Flavin reductase like domain-containing protein n=1 Tax=Echria macrotheca TaxID=438768 RepID=A0AAJ0BLU3_9PEZI|nr:flavin reductase like domain-containing protein [Echria macrotheca]